VVGLNQIIPVLAVRQYWAGLVASKRKTIEVRGYRAPRNYIGQTIAIYASKTMPDTELMRHIESLMLRYEGSKSLPTTCFTLGAIVATATLKSSVPCLSVIDFESWQKEHWNPLDYYKKGKTYYWVLEDIQPLSKPVSFGFHGPVVWSSIEAEKLAGWLD
jgi:hypothetical protein